MLGIICRLYTEFLFPISSELFSKCIFGCTAVGSLLCDELKDDVSIEKSVEEVAEVGSDTNVVPISEERQGTKDKSVSF